MIEYVFFHQQPLELFLQFLAGLGLDSTTRRYEDRMEVLLPDDLDAPLFEKIDARYDQLMDLEGDLTDSEQSGAAGEYQAGGIVVSLADNTTVYATLDSDLLARVMKSVTPEEFALIVDAIVQAVENRQESPACHRT
ncbi:MAG: hypothetical protein ACE5FQ_01040 [Thiogranum sp.]